MKILMAGGGTGGHLFPGLALAASIQEQRPQAEICFVGTRAGIEVDAVPRAGYPLQCIAAGRGSPLSIRSPLNGPRFLLALLQSLRLLKGADVLVALGGYAAAAPGLAAAFRRVPLVVLEQNMVPGRVNRLLSKWARQVHVQFTESVATFPASVRVYPSGSPMRSEIAALIENEPASGKTLLVMGGSQGAMRLNELVIEAMPRLRQSLGGSVVHVAGARNEDEVRRAYDRLGMEATVFGFCNVMPETYRRARLCISRAGAGSIQDLAAAGVPGIFIPLPSAKDDHQRKNAQVVTGRNGGVLLEQEGLTGEALAETVERLWADEARLVHMGHRIRECATPEAGAMIAKHVISIAEGTRS